MTIDADVIKSLCNGIAERYGLSAFEVRTREDLWMLESPLPPWQIDFELDGERYVTIIDHCWTVSPDPFNGLMVDYDYEELRRQTDRVLEEATGL